MIYYFELEDVVTPEDSIGIHIEFCGIVSCGGSGK